MIKKFLCKYFSEEDKKTVTIGSIIDNILTRLFFLLMLLVFVFGVYVVTAIVLYGFVFQLPIMDDSIYDITYNVLFAWMAVAIGTGVLINIIKVYVYARSIKITQCERKD